MGSKKKLPPGAFSGQGRAGDLAHGFTGRPPRAEDDRAYYLRPQDPLSLRRFAESMRKASLAAPVAGCQGSGARGSVGRGKEGAAVERIPLSRHDSDAG